jgi:hypothetical protein
MLIFSAARNNAMACKGREEQIARYFLTAKIFEVHTFSNQT